MPIYIELVGSLAAAITTLCWIPQIIKIVRHRQTDSISLVTNVSLPRSPALAVLRSDDQFLAGHGSKWCNPLAYSHNSRAEAPLRLRGCHFRLSKTPENTISDAFRLLHDIAMLNKPRFQQANPG
ncbi:SemiSWEET family sugar transporter [Phyllobacterium sp. P5_D12]